MVKEKKFASCAHAIRRVTKDRVDGSYELAAIAGTHAICVGNDPEGGGFVPTSCTSITVAAQRVTRIDYEYGPGGGRWYSPDHDADRRQ